MSRYWPRLALALAAAGAYAATASLIPLGLEWISAAFAAPPHERIAKVRGVEVLGPLLVVGLGVLNGGAQYLHARLSIGAALEALRDIQRDMAHKLVTLDLAQLRKEASGQTVARFTADPPVLRESLTRLTRGAADLLTLLGLCGVMIYYDAVLFAVVVAVYALIGWPISELGRFLRRRSADAQEQAGAVAAYVSETLGGATQIRAYNQEAATRARGDGFLEERLRRLKSVSYTKALSEPMVFALGAAAIAIVVAVVAQRIMAGAIDGPQFVSFLVALLMLSQPARGLSTLNASLQEGLAAFDRMTALIDQAPSVRDAPGAGDLVAAKASVVFERVGFSYDGENDGAAALQDLSFEASPGETLALVGESGAGKSTVFNLLMRFYDPQSGVVRIDGQPIAEARLRSLREHVALVTQEAFLFDDTVRANIAFGRPDADDAAIEEAARQAAAHVFIEAMPGGYEALVGERGGKLSGGQRQRIALARAFLKDAPILLLDEPTAALDAESEAHIQDALARLTKGRTTLVIAHRLATVRAADAIIVLDKGRVVERGSHDGLIAAGGPYARLAALQFG